VYMCEMALKPGRTSQVPNLGCFQTCQLLVHMSTIDTVGCLLFQWLLTLIDTGLRQSEWLCWQSAQYGAAGQPSGTLIRSIRLVRKLGHDLVKVACCLSKRNRTRTVSSAGPKHPQNLTSGSRPVWVTHTGWCSMYTGWC